MPNPYKTIKKQKDSKLTHANAKLHGLVQTQSIKAVDFDGTLAKEQHPYDPHTAGPPIPRTIKLVKKWMKQNEQIVIFTSRVSPSVHNNLQIRYARKLISAWCKHYLGKSFPITSDKSPRLEIWDNRSHRVETDTGRVLAQAMFTEKDIVNLNNKYYGRVIPKHKISDCPFLHIKNCSGCGRSCSCYIKDKR